MSLTMLSMLLIDMILIRNNNYIVSNNNNGKRMRCLLLFGRLRAFRSIIYLKSFLFFLNRL